MAEARFTAKFKKMEARSRDQFVRLEFEASDDQVQEVARVLLGLGSAVRLRIQASGSESDGVAVDAILSRVTFDGGGRSWVRFTADLAGAADLFTYVNQVVEVTLG